MSHGRPSPSGHVFASLARLVFFLTFAACGGPCGGSRRAVPSPTVLSSLPPETQIALSLDFARLRRGATWPALRAALGDAGRPEDRAMVQTFAERTGFDPFTQVDRVTIAFPENARDKDTFAVLLAAHGLDANRLIAYIRERLAEKGDDLTSSKQAGFLTWSTHQPPLLEGAFLARDEVVVGAGDFPRAIMGRRATSLTVAPPSALEPALEALIGALGVQHEVWGAAVVPASTRERLLSEPRFHAAASVRRLGLAVDLDPELDATVLADLGSEADAAALAREAQQAVQRAKADPKLLLLGLPSFLERVTVASHGLRFSLTLRLDPEKTRELLSRVASWSALASTPRPPPPPGFP